MTDLLNAWFQVDLGEGAFYAAFGFAFVILGISLLILIFTLLGLVMRKVNERKARKKEEKRTEAPKEVPVPEAAPQQREEGVTPELVAVISAAVAAYYAGTTKKCDFVVRKIKRL